MCNGMKIKLKRIEKGFSSKEFSKLSGISRYQLSAIENCRVREPRLSTITKIAKTLDCQIEDIVLNEGVENYEK